MRDELYEEMFVMEQRHWWFAAKHKIVAHLLRRYLAAGEGGRRLRIADLGCGCGMMPYVLGRLGYDVVGLDASAQAAAFAAQRGVRIEQGLLPGPVPLEKESFDAVLLLDVLEHLDEDLATAVTASNLLRTGGILLCTVPAYQWLWSRRDEHHQHRRRYGRSQFRELFEQPQLRGELCMEMLSYMNTLLFPAAAAARLTARWRGSDGMTDLRIPPPPVNAMLRGLFASERGLLGRVPLPFGLSLVAVARKTATAPARETAV